MAKIRKESICRHGSVSIEEAAYLVYTSYQEHEYRRYKAGEDNPIENPVYNHLWPFLVSANTQDTWATDPHKAIRDAILDVSILRCDYCDIIRKQEAPADTIYIRKLVLGNINRQSIFIYDQEVSPLSQTTAQYINEWVDLDGLDDWDFLKS